jgi:small-conductance mechanosensitive channel
MQLAADFETLLGQLETVRAWWQIGVIAGGYALAWLIARSIRARLPADLEPGALKIGAGSIHRLVLPLLALIFVWLGKFALSKWQPVPLLNIAIPLIASYVAIRLTLYLLRHLIPPSALLKASERIIALGVWAIVALYLTGVLPEIASALNEISFVAGKQTITLLTVLQALFWSVFTVFVALSISRIIETRLMETESLDRSMRVFAGKLVRAFAVVLAILIALPLMGIDITVLSVFGGALGVGLGLGLQKIASNYVSGFVILLDRSIRPGDLVTITDRHGVVIDIKARYTVLKGLDGTEAIIPNDSIISNTVLNHSYSDKVVAVKTAVTVSYQSDVDKVIAILLTAGRTQARVLASPEPSVMMKNLGDNGIEFELTTWINDAEQGQGSLRSSILIDVWRAFQAGHIEVPYPQREIRILRDNTSDATTRPQDTK